MLSFRRPRRDLHTNVQMRLVLQLRLGLWQFTFRVAN